MGIAKATLKKCELSGKDPELAFLLMRATPVSSNLPSPSELLYNRSIRSTLPSMPKFSVQNERTKDMLWQRQETQKLYFDRGAHDLSDLKTGTPVMLQDHTNLKWKPATVVTPSKEPRSYVVQTTDGARYRRNRKYIRPLPVNRERQEEIPKPMQGTATQEISDTKDALSRDSPCSPKKTVTIATEPTGSASPDAPEQATRRSSRSVCPPKRLISEM